MKNFYLIYGVERSLVNNELTKLNIGKSVTNENNGMYGKLHSEETKNKQSENWHKSHPNGF